MLSSQLRRIVSSLAPERTAYAIAKRKYGHLKLDHNNFSHADQIRALLGGYELISFDLFDTLVWREMALNDVQRKTAEFAEYHIPGDHGPLPSGLLLHARRRHQNEVKRMSMASKQNYRNEVDLAEVFDGALSPYISDTTRRARAVEAAIAFEIETEHRVLTVDPAMRELLIDLRARGKTVILTSDMYFSERWLKTLLDRLGLLDMFDHVFVSATVGVTKHSGLLFQHVDATLNSAGLRRIHLGDNWNNDVVQPRKHGWDALHYLNTENEMRKDRLERLSRIGTHKRDTAAKELIRQVQTNDSSEAVIRLISAGFLSFARQVLSTAMLGHYDRILFLTRDGTIFHHILRQMIENTGARNSLDLPEMGELAFSRRAGVLLTMPDPDSPAWPDYIRHNVGWLRGEFASLGAIMRSFALHPDELEGMRGNDSEVDACLDAGGRSHVDFQRLLDEPALFKPLAAAMKAKQQRVADYLDQQGLFEPRQRILLVDIGYSGTVLKAFSEHMYRLAAKGQKVETCLAMMMFAANRFFGDNLGQMHPRAIMLDPVMIGQEHWRQRAAAFNFAWLEPFAVDRSRGSLGDFQPDEGGRLQPVFAKGTKENGPVTRTRILEMTRETEALLRLSPVTARDADAAIGRAITASFAAPRRKTLHAIDNLTHQAGLSDIVEHKLVREVRPWRLRSDLLRCLHEDRWIQGSMAASGLGWLNPVLNRLLGIITR